MLGLRETFIKRYIVLRPEEHSEKAKSCRENLWNEIVERAVKTETDTRIENKRVGKFGWFISKT